MSSSNRVNAPQIVSVTLAFHKCGADDAIPCFDKNDEPLAHLSDSQLVALGREVYDVCRERDVDFDFDLGSDGSTEEYSDDPSFDPSEEDDAEAEFTDAESCLPPPRKMPRLPTKDEVQQESQACSQDDECAMLSTPTKKPTLIRAPHFSNVLRSAFNRWCHHMSSSVDSESPMRKVLAPYNVSLYARGAEQLADYTPADIDDLKLLQTKCLSVRLNALRALRARGNFDNSTLWSIYEDDTQMFPVKPQKPFFEVTDV
jgi:hypothetical protein